MAESLGVSRFVHVSHLNADVNSPSAFLRTKAEGEAAVKSAFEGATIVRPGPLYGHEDRFLNQMASEYTTSAKYLYNIEVTNTLPQRTLYFGMSTMEGRS